MYNIEITIRLNPKSISIQRQEFMDAEKVYQEICQAMEIGNPRMIKFISTGTDKKQICVLVSEILAVQVYKILNKQEDELNDIGDTHKRRAGFRV